ncbi:hypothetical protein QRQ56_31155 [Bradyrhizobium sp. U531]
MTIQAGLVASGRDGKESNALAWEERSVTALNLKELRELPSSKNDT